MAAEVTVVRPDQRAQMDTMPTPGMKREQAYFGGGAWVGVVHTNPGVISGWHHHGDYDTYVYLTSGKQIVEFGRDRQDQVEAGAGDVIHVGKHVVHRESNPSTDETVTFVVRVGNGPLVVNVDGPGTTP